MFKYVCEEDFQKRTVRKGAERLWNRKKRDAGKKLVHPSR